jgi:hypothetical protein
MAQKKGKPAVGIRSALAGEMSGIDDQHRVKFETYGAGLNVAHPGQKQRREPVAVSGAAFDADATSSSNRSRGVSSKRRTRDSDSG